MIVLPFGLRGLRLLAASLALALAPMASLSAEPSADLAELAVGLAPPVSKPAIKQIDDLGRRLLALRSYLRSSSNLADRWSWTEQEIEEFQGSPEQLALLNEVAAIKAHFSRENPGYEIYANTKVRSLDVQIARWNESVSVGSAASELLSDLKAHFSNLGTRDKLSGETLRTWLVRYAPDTRPSLAAPGLTRHGQAHAIDFQVMREGKLIAEAAMQQIEPIWIADGWAEKLAESVNAAGPSFSGPLESPNEPWHYDYLPKPGR